MPVIRRNDWAADEFTYVMTSGISIAMEGHGGCSLLHHSALIWGTVQFTGVVWNPLGRMGTAYAKSHH